MLAQVRKSHLVRGAQALLLLGVVSTFASCATKEQPPLISDGRGRESTIPWNQQQKWEQQGSLGPMAERFETRR